MQMSGFAGSVWSYDWIKFKTIFSFLKYLHTIFHSGCTNLHSYQQCRNVPFLHTLFSIYYLYTIWWSLYWLLFRWYFTEVLTCASLIISTVEHLFTCFFSHLYLHTLEINSMSAAWFDDIFSQLLDCLFILFMISFVLQKLLSSWIFLITINICWWFSVVWREMIWNLNSVI